MGSLATTLDRMTLSPMPEGDPSLGATPRTTLKRRAERGCHDAAVVYAILDEALVCHVAVHVDGGPNVLPVAHARISDRLYLRGARANRLLGVIATGAQACVAVTLLDGLVFGRSWFHPRSIRATSLAHAPS